MRKESEARRIEVSKVLKENLELIDAERKKEKTTEVKKRDVLYSVKEYRYSIFSTLSLNTWAHCCSLSEHVHTFENVYYFYTFSIPRSASKLSNFFSVSVLL